MKRDLERERILVEIYQESYNRLQAQIDRFYINYAGREGSHETGRQNGRYKVQ